MDAELHLAFGLASALALAGIARAARLTAAELGLDGSGWWRGLRWGAGAVAVVAAAYGGALLLPPVRAALAGPPDPTVGALLAGMLVVIPLGTVLPEELAFRGILWSLLRRRHGEPVASAASSVLFGLWHLLPAASGGGAANQVATDALGGGPAGTVLRVLGTVLLTTVAGLVLCALRTRSRSLLAPVLAHWAANALGLLALWIA